MRTPAQFQTVRFSVPAQAVLAIVASLMVCPDDARSQIPAFMPEGTRVRVTAPGLGLHEAVGVVQERDEGGPMVTFEGPWAEIPLASEAIRDLDVSVGSRSRGALGGLVGLLAGGTLGAYLGAANGLDEKDMQHCFSQGGAASALVGCTMAGGASILASGVFYGFLGGGVGLLVGRSIGRRVKTDVWAPAGEAGATFSVTPAVQPEGAALAISISF